MISPPCRPRPQTAVEKFGGIDIVVANAGIASYGSVLNVDPEAVKRVLDVNLLGVFHTVRAALPSIIDRRGYVLIVSSLAAFAAAPGMAPYDMSKAGNEHLAHALRLEVAHLGVAVGSAHMSWIDTALVRDTQEDLPIFREQLAKFPWPLNKTTSVDKCAAAFVDGIEHRKKRVYCPGWVGVFRWLKPFLSTRFGEGPILKTAGGQVTQMDAEVAALGQVHQRAHPAAGEVLTPEARAAAAQVALELGGQRVAVDLAQRLGHVDLGVTPLLQ